MNLLFKQDMAMTKHHGVTEMTSTLDTMQGTRILTEDIFKVGDKSVVL